MITALNQILLHTYYLPTTQKSSPEQRHKDSDTRYGNPEHNAVCHVQPIQAE